MSSARLDGARPAVPAGLGVIPALRAGLSASYLVVRASAGCAHPDAARPARASSLCALYARRASILARLVVNIATTVALGSLST